jgi:hypothetical protein
MPPTERNSLRLQRFRSNGFLARRELHLLLQGARGSDSAMSREYRTEVTPSIVRASSKSIDMAQTGRVLAALL